MKNSILLLVITTALIACNSPSPQTNAKPTDLNMFNPELAKEYGADDYGMKKFVIAFLKRGPNRDQDSITAARLQRAHLDNITELAEAGKLVLAGPFFGDDDLRGIYIFNVDNLEDAKKLTETDPAIQEGSLVMELREWYGSAALMAINDLHKKIAKEGI
jgi:uncharacterized protein YciI